MGISLSLTACAMGVVVNRAKVAEHPDHYMQADFSLFSGSSTDGFASGFSYAYRKPSSRHVEYGIETSFYTGFFKSGSINGYVSAFLWDVYGKLSGSIGWFNVGLQMGIGLTGGADGENGLILPGARASILMGFGRSEPLTIGITVPPAAIWGSVNLGRFSFFLSASAPAMYVGAMGIGAGFGFTF